MNKFELSEKQIKKFERWRKAKKGDPYSGAAGGSYCFCFTPTGIGTIVVVKCVDNTELDLTDFDEFA